MHTVIQRTITGLLLALLFCIIFFYTSPLVLSTIIAALLLYVLYFEWPRIITIFAPSAWLLTCLYPITPFVLLILLNQEPDHHALVFFLVLLVAVHDTSSYFVGSRWGKHKIAPTISPGKTWQGFLGGILGTYIILRAILYYQQVQPSWYQVTLVCLTICSLALVGDLFESWLKRRAQLKDSGSILPGHGGLLDRLDGVLFVAFFFYATRNWLTSFFGLVR